MDVAVTDRLTYAIDVAAYRIVAVDRRSGQVVAQTGGTRTLGEDGMIATARASAVDSEGNVYVADTPNGRIQKFSADQRVQRRSPDGRWTAFDAPVGGTPFASAWGVTVAPDGTIWIADSGNHRIVRDGRRRNAALGGDRGHARRRTARLAV